MEYPVRVDVCGAASLAILCCWGAVRATGVSVSNVFNVALDTELIIGAGR